MDDSEREELARLFDDLAGDTRAMNARLDFCRMLSGSLGQLSRHLSVRGQLFGPDRKSGVSPFGLGDDGVVGLGTVAGIGSRLIEGAADLLASNNEYAGSALLRQLVEVEYLAHAFADDRSVAATWLRSDRDERRRFWSPAELRKRADGKFLATDYWHHCDWGGHPTVEGARLLSDHGRSFVGYLVVDLQGHASRIWRFVAKSAEEVFTPPPGDSSLDDIRQAIATWIEADQLHRSMSGLTGDLRELGEIE